MRSNPVTLWMSHSELLKKIKLANIPTWLFERKIESPFVDTSLASVGYEQRRCSVKGADGHIFGFPLPRTVAIRRFEFDVILAMQEFWVPDAKWLERFLNVK